MITRFVELPNVRRVLRSAGVVALAAMVLAPLALYAQSDEVATVGETAGFAARDLTDIIGTIINIFLGTLGVVFLLLVVYSGFVWMTAGGDDKKVDKAKKILINATVGLVITMSAYAIASFVINLVTDATGSNGSGSPSGSVSLEPRSGSRGNGAIQDHYPERNATDVARNARIIVTFRDAMDASSMTIGDNILVYPTAEGEAGALAASEATVTATEDGRTFVIDPAQYLGSSTADTSYTVFLDDNIQDAEGDTVINSGGYEWSFEVGTEIDLTPPTVTSVTPANGSGPDRNIAVQLTFSEAVDPTSATGTYGGATDNFTNIQIVGSSGAPEAGTYEISNGYRTITFTPAEACGTNSCNETIFCLPSSQTLTATAFSATSTSNPPQADSIDYDGVVDMTGNALDGNDDGTVGTDDDYTWTFTTTGDINLSAPTIESITPNIQEGDVALDQDITIVFSDVMMGSTITTDNIRLTNEESITGEAHEQWFGFAYESLTAEGQPVDGTESTPEKTEVTVTHGTFLESTDTALYVYGVAVDEGVRNEYQNCFMPAEGTNATGGSCGTTESSPYCCNGVASSTACSLF